MLEVETTGHRKWPKRLGATLEAFAGWLQPRRSAIGEVISFRCAIFCCKYTELLQSTQYDRTLQS